MCLAVGLGLWGVVLAAGRMHLVAGGLNLWGLRLGTGGLRMLGPGLRMRAAKRGRPTGCFFWQG